MKNLLSVMILVVCFNSAAIAGKYEDNIPKCSNFWDGEKHKTEEALAVAQQELETGTRDYRLNEAIRILEQRLERFTKAKMYCYDYGLRDSKKTYSDLLEKGWLGKTIDWIKSL
jgi:hypothetical protein